MMAAEVVPVVPVPALDGPSAMGICNTLIHSWKHTQEWQISRFVDLPASFTQIKSQPFDMMIGPSLAKWYFTLRRGHGGTQGSVRHSSYAVHLFLSSESVVEQVSTNLILRVVNNCKARRRAILEQMQMEKTADAELSTELAKEKDSPAETNTSDLEVKELVRVFKRGKGFGCGEFSRNTIITQRENFIPEGVITIAIDISVFDKVENVDCSGMKLAAPESLLGTDIGALLNERTYSDFTITCKQRTFFAHRAILAARSRVFAKMMETNMSERSTGKADFKNMDPEVLEQVLVFIYTGNAPKLASLTKELFSAANEFGMDELRSVCGSKLARTVGIKTICPLLMLTDAVMDESDGFKEYTLNYFRKHCAEILGTDEWAELDAANPQLAHSLMRATILAGSKKRKRLVAPAEAPQNGNNPDEENAD